MIRTPFLISLVAALLIFSSPLASRADDVQDGTLSGGHPGGPPPYHPPAPAPAPHPEPHPVPPPYHPPGPQPGPYPGPHPGPHPGPQPDPGHHGGNPPYPYPGHPSPYPPYPYPVNPTPDQLFVGGYVDGLQYEFEAYTADEIANQCMSWGQAEQLDVIHELVVFDQSLDIGPDGLSLSDACDTIASYATY